MELVSGLVFTDCGAWGSPLPPWSIPGHPSWAQGVDVGPSRGATPPPAGVSEPGGGGTGWTGRSRAASLGLFNLPTKTVRAENSMESR